MPGITIPCAGQRGRQPDRLSRPLFFFSDIKQNFKNFMQKLLVNHKDFMYKYMSELHFIR